MILVLWCSLRFLVLLSACWLLIWTFGLVLFYIVLILADLGFWVPVSCALDFAGFDL